MVDDELDVHEASRLILNDLTFGDREIELLSAESGVQAREILSCHRDIALVLLDVVMETDRAGIELVQYIREEKCDSDMQIVLRTGQPGMAPERDVILRYEINGYFLKTDLTSQRLRSIVISSLRSYRHTRALRATLARDLPGSYMALPNQPPPGLVEELETAHQRDAILVQTRPEVALASNRVTGIELVLLWKTSEDLLPVERVCEVMPEGPGRRHIVRWLFELACSCARSWRIGQNDHLTVSLPLIGECLRDTETVEMLVEATANSGLPVGTLDLLVSEASLYKSDPDVLTAMTTLCNSGLTFTVTDFGAQTISLQRLTKLMPHRLKIHRLFVQEVANDSERTALARSLIALAQTMNIGAMADGINSDSDAQFFKWEGCELGQGDALAPAGEFKRVAELLQSVAE